MKVLFICYYFPPIIATGCNRSLAFAQNLEKVSSYKPLILSVNNAKDPWIKVGTNTTNDFEIVRTEEWNLAAFVDVLQGISSKIFSLFGKDLKINIFREFITIPDTQIAWFKTIQGIELAKGSDIIYVSCSPFSSAVSSCFIKYFSKKPLVVDFRDAWTLNPHIKHSSFHNFIIKYLEKFVISNCDALILNTEGALKLYCDEYPEHSKKFHYVANGYDSLTPVSKSKQPNDTFNIMNNSTINLNITRSGIANSFILNEIYDNNKEYINKQWLSMKNEDFVIWNQMDTLPNIKKLYGIINNDMKGTYYITINNSKHILN